MLEAIKGMIPGIAKAVAAFVTPFLLLGATWVAEKVGVPIDVDPEQVNAWVTTAVVSIVTALAVYQTSNRTPEPVDPGE